MLKAKNIIYGFCKYTNPPKNKYLISLYRSEELNIIAVFPTSQHRAGVAVPRHGCNIRDGKAISYVFDAGHPVGQGVYRLDLRILFESVDTTEV